MEKMFGVLFLSLLGFAAMPFQGEAANAAPATNDRDPVQHCLDLVQMGVARKIAPARPIGSRPVQNPSRELPLQCVSGNLEEIKTALRNQIANCERKSDQDKARTFQFGCRMVKHEDYC